MWGGFGPVGFFPMNLSFFMPCHGESCSSSLISMGISSSPSIVVSTLAGSSFSFSCFTSLGVCRFNFCFFSSSSFASFSFFLALVNFLPPSYVLPVIYVKNFFLSTKNMSALVASGKMFLSESVVDHCC